MNLDLYWRLGRCIIEYIDPMGVVKRQPSDTDLNLAFVVAEAVERGFKPARIVLRTVDQREWPDGCFVRERNQRRGARDCVVELSIPSLFNRHGIGLGIGRARLAF